ncbi:hypothetical protein ILUMI_10861 [Ignelater luminosus]|uniref:G-patch domain-containing protein n=1 Tax=Ignelater luminosus TaxID=2038154 RepID=A0A8K0GDR9_IGNLU|nr:hypothetical protein ILUMI_10861 [Ignelater luminosus]
MSMLAERKQKQKWILSGGSMNRKNDWSKDSNKFGQKMLERMGWKEGKGLGRNEDGLTEHVKVLYKSDNKGIGFKDSVEWSAQQDNFKALLEELSTSNVDSNDKPQNVKSLEEKSQNSRARVHYRKFTRGKDLSRYSEKDLANIFGKKKLNCEKSDDTVEEVEQESTITAGVVTVFGGSMVDYFRNKKGFNIRGVKDEDNSEEERVIQKHILGTITENEIENELQTPENKESCKRKKKKSKNLVDAEENQVDCNKYTNREVENENDDEGTIQRKKKKKLKGLDNPVLNITDSNHENDSFNDRLDNSEVKPDTTPSNCNNAVDFEIKHKKKKKLKGIDNLALKLNESDSKLGGKRNSDCNDDLDGNQTEDFKVKHKKKNKSKGIDNPALNLNDSNNTSSEKSLQNGIENPTLEILDCDIMLNVTDEPVKTPVTPKAQKYTPKHKTKTVRFSKTNQEFIIDNRSPDDITKRNELYDINTKVIEDGLRNLKKKNQHVEDCKFDIKSIDKLDFCNDTPLPKKNHLGIDNKGFDIRAQKVEESVNMITRTIDHYQAEVENGINESKLKRTRMNEEYMVGELNCSDGENEVHDDGVKLRFKYAKFNRIEPMWAKRNDAQTTLPKKSYKHLIRGDIIIGFKNSNLHEIPGYGMVGRCGQRS